MRLRLAGSRYVPSSELALVAEQLWPGLERSRLQVSLGSRVPSGAVVLERHSLLVWRKRILMVLPSNRRIAAAALRVYGGLRPRRRRAVRQALSLFIRLGMPLKQLVVYERCSAGPGTRTVLTVIADRLRIERPAIAMSVRRTANRKALLQVLDQRGRTVGFVKMGWNATSSRGVEVERVALSEIDGGTDRIRTPRVLASGTVNGFPYLLVEPLPTDLYRDGEGFPEAPELEPLFRIHRMAPVAQTGHFQRLVRRVAVLEKVPETAEVIESLTILLEEVGKRGQEMAVVERWHGDFASWNVGRTAEGTVWCWDFENGDQDALLGLDVVHWHASVLRETRGAAGLMDSDALRRNAARGLTECGLGPEEQTVVHAVYIAEVVARTLEIAAADVWSAVWASPEDLIAILTPALKFAKN